MMLSTKRVNICKPPIYRQGTTIHTITDLLAALERFFKMILRVTLARV